MKYSDAHCHITKIPAPDIACCICNATNESDWDKIIENTNSETIFGAIGIHPWHLDSIKPGWESRLYAKLIQNPTIMVGEIGLDKYKPDMPQQIQIFTTQIKIAGELRRPISLHCVGAWDKVMHILKAMGHNLPPAILAHGFNENAQIITQTADKYNIYFSYSAHNSTPNLPDIIRATPNSRILTESDAFEPDCEMKPVIDSVKIISESLDISCNDTTEQIYENFQRMVSYVRPIE